VGADNVCRRSAQGKWVLEKFPNGAKIIFLRGEPGASPAIDRSQGFYEVIKAGGDKYKVVADQTANFARSQGMTVTQNLLTSLGAPPDVIVSSNDDMALGAIAALKQSGVSKGKVPVIGYDALPEALRAIREGEMAATVEQSPGKQVQTALDQLVDHIPNKKPLQNVSIAPFVVDNTQFGQGRATRRSKIGLGLKRNESAWIPPISKIPASIGAASRIKAMRCQRLDAQSPGVGQQQKDSRPQDPGRPRADRNVADQKRCVA
jgi:ABC-type sugar transport system substrate-binding protein